jgi:UDP-4-amino-4,6-dideoxy-N-acetyl-beta-L-altrosamine N-acetyltransferase
MSNPALCTVRRLQASDLPTILQWRNHPQIRSMMLAQHEISWQEHLAWFERLNQDPTRQAILVEERDVPLGFIHFSNTAAGSTSDWGFYAAPYAVKGTGRKIGTTGLNYAFGELKLHKICGQALSFNEASIRFHLKLGFQQESILRSHHKLGNHNYDLVCFGLVATQWLHREPNQAKEIK